MIFDGSGTGLKRTYIGPLSHYHSDKMYSQSTSPMELVRELKRISKVRKAQEAISQLKGKHELSSLVDRPKTTQHSSSPFLLVGSPMYNSMMESKLGIEGSITNPHSSQKITFPHSGIGIF